MKDWFNAQGNSNFIQNDFTDIYLYHLRWELLFKIYSEKEKGNVIMITSLWNLLNFYRLTNF